MKIEFTLTDRANEDFVQILDKFELHLINNERVFFWQPTEYHNNDFDLEDIVELMLEHHSLAINSHCYINPFLNFEEGVNECYLESKKVTRVYACLMCNTNGAGRDVRFDEGQLIPDVIEVGCPVCSNSKLHLTKESGTINRSQ